jgi:nicotinate-nucleotide pyrophosphorylase (carboxylating)
MMHLPAIATDLGVLDAIRRSLEEDLGGVGDVTTLSLVPEDAYAEARIIARNACVVAGTTVAAAVFAAVDSGLDCRTCISDGSPAQPGDTVMTLSGYARGILTGERTALNFMQRMAGIATLTRAFVEKAAPHGVAILDTRKTTPTLRVFEKYAVLCGGGTNHRMGLYDRAMIKDNHRNLWREGDASRLDLAVAACRARFPGVAVEVEVETEAELHSALAAGPEWILLDNMPPEEMRRCVEIVAGLAKVEASGGITLETVTEVARSGVDAISLGCLTHTVAAADLSLEIVSDAIDSGS